MKNLRYLRGVTIVAFATVAFLITCQWLFPSSFGDTTVVTSIISGLLMTVLAYIAFYAVGIAVMFLLSLEVPGLLLQILVGTVTGTFAIWLTGKWIHGLVLLHPLSIVPFALANTLFTLLLAYASGMMPKQFNLLPQRSNQPSVK